MEYPVFLNSEMIGIATVDHIGLYGHIQCRCHSADAGICRLIMTFSDKSVDLGLWVREQDYFVVDRKVPWKSFGCGDPCFTVLSHNVLPAFFREQLEPGNPISNLETLEKCKLCQDGDRWYLQAQSRESRGSA